MSSKIRNIIKKLGKGQEAEELLPQYVEECMALNSRYAHIRLMMEYYMFYETVSEGINPYIDTVQDIVGELQQTFETLFEGKADAGQRKELADGLLGMRQRVVDRMQVLTAYVDQFVIYEYILNRVQYRFEDREPMPDDKTFARDLVQFIFSAKDNAAINENIRYAIGQLPMRMARSRYFDWIKECISVYKGGDKNSLDSFLYMFRTNAALYQDDNMGKYFTEFASALDEFSALDYENITQEVYEIYAEKLAVNVSKITDISDLYMELGQLINDTYGVCSTGGYVMGEPVLPEAGLVIRGINALFLEKESDVWQAAGKDLESEEDKLDWLSGLLTAVEGKQETVFESLTVAEAELEELYKVHEEHIKALGLTEDFAVLRKLSLLTSSSVFADLSLVQNTEETVTEEFAEETAAALIAECKAFFKEKSRMFRRAVMANTLEKMPMPFRTADEVAEYVKNSLGQCEDEAEKYAAKQLLLEIMGPVI